MGLDKGAARERVRVARALGTLPRIARAFAGGKISYSKVRAVTRVATPELADRLHSAAIHLLRRARRTDPLTGVSAAQLSALSVLISGPKTLGEVKVQNQSLKDLSWREIAVFAPLVIWAFWIGLNPQPYFRVLERPVAKIGEERFRFIKPVVNRKIVLRFPAEPPRATLGVL